MNENDAFFEELKRDVDADHRTIDGANAPPATMWATIRAQAQPPIEEESEMISTTQLTQYLRAPGARPRRSREAVADPYPRVIDNQFSDRRGFIHYLNIASTVALVAVIALGGWFTMMQLNSSDGSGGMFGLFMQSDDAATCEVEPMTVDEVMEVIENPYRYMDVSKYPTPRWGSTEQKPWLDDFAEVYPTVDSTLIMGAGDTPTNAAFDQSSKVISHYIACLQEDPSVAMMLRFSDPISIQHHIRQEFPFYRTEEQVHEYVSEWLRSGDTLLEFNIMRNSENYTFRMVSDREYATTQIHDFGLGFDQVIYLGTAMYDERGQFVGNYHPTMYQTYGPEGLLDFGVVFTLIHSRYTGEWYVVTGDWMFTGGN